MHLLSLRRPQLAGRAAAAAAAAAEDDQDDDDGQQQDEDGAAAPKPKAPAGEVAAAPTQRAKQSLLVQVSWTASAAVLDSVGGARQCRRTHQQKRPGRAPCMMGQSSSQAALLLCTGPACLHRAVFSCTTAGPMMTSARLWDGAPGIFIKRQTPRDILDNQHLGLRFVAGAYTSTISWPRISPGQLPFHKLQPSAGQLQCNNTAYRMTPPPPPHLPTPASPLRLLVPRRRLPLRAPRTRCWRRRLT